MATVVVAMSRIYESPSTPLAPSAIGFVPRAGMDDLVGYMMGEVLVKDIA